MEWGIVSYIIRYYFNPCGTGSHLYSANTNTLRSRTLSSRTYPTLVGLAFGFCLASLFVPLLYHNLGDLSRGFFIFFRLSFRALVSAASLAYPHPKVETLGSVVPPLDNDSISQTAPKVKNFFQKIFS
jgi:hypothetical protein